MIAIKKIGLSLVIGSIFLLHVQAQQTAGTSGLLLNTPSADFNPDGTFSLGGNYLPETVTPPKFDYPTGNYFLNITYFSFLELTYRSTFLRIPENKNKMTNQDRSIALRVRLLKESKVLPAFVLGANDILTSKFLTIVENEGGGNQFFGSIYGVATKNISVLGQTVGLTLGYSYAKDSLSQYTGALAGVRVSPSFFRPLSVVAEYDAENINVGASVLLFKHLYVQVFTSEFKNISAGISYRIQLKVAKNP